MIHHSLRFWPKGTAVRRRFQDGTVANSLMPLLQDFLQCRSFPDVPKKLYAAAMNLIGDWMLRLVGGVDIGCPICWGNPGNPLGKETQKSTEEVICTGYGRLDPDDCVAFGAEAT